MSETPTSSSEPATTPVTPTSAAPAVRDEPRRSKLTALAAWVAIVAGVVFIVAVIFFSGFVLGARSGGHFGPPGGPGSMQFRHGPPPGFPMPPGDFGPPPGPGFGPFGPDGPRFAPPQPPGGPESPGTTTTTPRP